jgi:hypothetical protein
MNEMGKNLLTNAAFSGDQHARIGRCDMKRFLEKIEDDPATAEYG